MTDADSLPHESERERIQCRLQEAVAVLSAIDAGELLAEPPCGPARPRHLMAVCLLAMLERDLRTLAITLGDETA